MKSKTRLALLDLDVEGAAALRAAGVDCLTLFLTPTSIQEFERRLRLWLTESDATIGAMLEQAEAENKEAIACGNFDHVLVNE